VRLTHHHFANLISGIAFGTHSNVRAKAARQVKQLQSLHSRWWDPANVVGLCFARKISGGVLGPPALQILVRNKHPLHRLDRRQRIPKSIEVTAVGLEGEVLTDVREVGRSRFHALSSSARPEQPGFNVGNEQGGSGTLCCVVTSQSPSGLRLGLSCAHVIGRYGRAHAGEVVMMPARPDAQALDELADAPIGRLVTIASPGFAISDAPANVDAATFKPKSASSLDARIALLGIRPGPIRDAIPLGLEVQKVGYASELTTGIVQALHVLASFPMPTDQSQRTVWFAEQIGISQFATDGDSGSLVLDKTGRSIGMHIGGFQNMSLCTPIRRVLKSVQCDLP